MSKHIGITDNRYMNNIRCEDRMSILALDTYSRQYVYDGVKQHIEVINISHIRNNHSRQPKVWSWQHI